MITHDINNTNCKRVICNNCTYRPSSRMCDLTLREGRSFQYINMYMQKLTSQILEK